jgi:N-methylhydantoinase A
MTISIGFDVGGTFTDLMLFDSGAGAWHVAKVRTTPANLAAGCLEGVRSLLAQAGVGPQEVGYVAHGSTVATNTLLERRGAKTALVTTRGFRDVLEIRRQVMPHRYDPRVPKPEPLVERPLRTEVRERTLADGSVEAEVDVAQLRELLGTFQAEGIEAVAISFLHSYANPANERLAADVAREAGGWFVSTSHEVLNELREYERTSSVVANAYLAPSMRSYLGALEWELRRIGVRAPLLVFQSNGGLVPAAGAAEMPIRCLISGPAAGVVAGCAVAERCRIEDFISLDIGGTSCDVALVHGREPREAAEQEVAGWPIRAPRLDVHSIGAGGGSIAWVDGGGLLRVGPRSAGAQPGPAAYALGGGEPTVTDAQVVLGRIGPGQRLAGGLVVDGCLAASAVSGLAHRLGLSDAAAALGILDVVNAAMIQAIRLISVEQGHDPRGYALVAFGGAGALHACELAAAMGLQQVVVPPRPGVFCALGLLLADMRVDASTTRHLGLGTGSSQALRVGLKKLADQLRSSPAVASRPRLDWRVSYAADVRYVGQGFHLPVPLNEEEVGGLDDEHLAQAFDEAHRAAYGYAWEWSPREVVGLRASLRAGVGTGPSRMPALTPAARSPRARRVFFRGSGWVDACPVLSRESCSPGFTLTGPAVIEQMDATLLLTPDFRLTVDDGWNLVLTPARPGGGGSVR